MSLTKPLQHSDNCNWDADDNRAYGAHNRAERGPKWRLMMHKDDSGQLVRLSLALVTDAKAIYEDNARYRRTAKAVDQEEIVYPPYCAFDITTHRPLAWLETASPQEIRRALGAMRKTGERAAA